MLGGGIGLIVFVLRVGLGVKILYVRGHLEGRGFVL